ncbi:MAG: DUF5676 family membrane protein [Nanoarchaeota archaeon]|nr:DUF5676 family membrane protein [Nanoarchaeota archaeon]
MEKTTTICCTRYAHPTGLALGVTSGIIYVVCAAAVKFWPAPTVSFFNNWFHGINFTPIFDPTRLTWAAFFKGLISVIIAAYLIGMLYVLLYNKCVEHCKRKGWI